MVTPLLRTKVHIPRTRGDLVCRPRLGEQLNSMRKGKLILISAPAGFGKTTFLCDWIQSVEQPVAWISLDPGAAIQVIEERGVRFTDTIDFGSLPSYPVLAKAFIQKGRLEEALRLLDRVQEFVEEKGLTRIVIETLVHRAIAVQKQGEDEKAIDALEEALTLAEPEGFVRTFINEGAPMGKLLRVARARGIAKDYVGKLLTELEKEIDEEGPPTEIFKPSVDKAQASLVEPLTERELQVLRLLGTDLTAPDIAEALIVAVSTVRSHTKSIYNKLEANSRLEAVARAKEMGLMKN